MSTHGTTEETTMRGVLSSTTDSPSSIQISNHETIETAKTDGVKSHTATTFVVEAELRYLHQAGGDEYFIVTVTNNEDERLIPVRINKTERTTAWERFNTTELPNVSNTTYTFDSVKDSESIDTDSDAKTMFLTGCELMNGIEFITGVYHSQREAEDAATENIANEYRLDATSKRLAVGPETFDTHVTGECRGYKDEYNSKLRSWGYKAGNFGLKHGLEEKFAGVAALSFTGILLTFLIGILLSMTSLISDATFTAFLLTVVKPLAVILVGGMIAAFAMDAVQGSFPSEYSLIDTSIPTIVDNVTTRTRIGEKNPMHNTSGANEFESTTAKFTPTNTGITVTATIDDTLITWRFEKNQAGFVEEDVREFIIDNPVVTADNTAPITVKHVDDTTNTTSKWVSENGGWKIVADD